MNLKTDAAVSPVIGVLLMLVVTIIIAAIVSAFSGGLASDDSKAPQASFGTKVVIENITDLDTATFGPHYPDPYSARNGIQFEHKGGDSISLSDINIELENQGVTMLISGGDKLPSSTCIPKGTTDGGYFAKIAGSTSDKIIEPGDKFMFYADNNCISKDGTKEILWTSSTGGYGYGVLNEQYKYSIIDRKSNKIISSGNIILK